MNSNPREIAAESSLPETNLADVTATICRIFLEHLVIEIPDVEIDLIELGLLDSLTMVDLLVHLEREFGFKVVMDELDMDDFRSVVSIAGYVVRCRA